MTDADQMRTDTFRQNVNALRQVAALSGILLALTFVAVFASPKPVNVFAAAFAISGLALLSLGPLWLIRNPAIVLKIGPDGVHMPLGWRQPLAWRDIHRIRHLGETRALTGHRIWLAIDPAPGVLPDYRFPGPRGLERWYMRTSGIRLPLHALDAPPDKVIASLERFRPVARL